MAEDGSLPSGTGVSSPPRAGLNRIPESNGVLGGEKAALDRPGTLDTPHSASGAPSGDQGEAR